MVTNPLADLEKVVKGLAAISKPRARFVFLYSSVSTARGKAGKLQDEVVKILCSEAVAVFDTCVGALLYFDDPESAEVTRNPKNDLREEIEFALNVVKRVFKEMGVDKAFAINSGVLYKFLCSVFAPKTGRIYKKFGFNILLYYILAMKSKEEMIEVIFSTEW